jgi:hypothetical protein
VKLPEGLKFDLGMSIIATVRTSRRFLVSKS